MSVVAQFGWLQLSPTHPTHSPHDGRRTVGGRARLTISVGFHYCCCCGGRVCEQGTTASSVDVQVRLLKQISCFTWKDVIKPTASLLVY